MRWTTVFPREYCSSRFHTGVRKPGHRTAPVPKPAPQNVDPEDASCPLSGESYD